MNFVDFYICKIYRNFFTTKRNFIQLEPIENDDSRDPVNPCVPSPCGPYSICKSQNNKAACSCLPHAIGIPPSCRLECMVNSDCINSQSCMNNRCVDPCRSENVCGIGARCQVTSHSAVCTCPPKYTGDPFIRCILESTKTILFIIK